MNTKRLPEILPCSSFYWAWLTGTLEILIPRRNLSGWLRVPAGHHSCARTSAIENALKCDICGLDGTLSIDCGTRITSYLELRAEFAARALPLIEEWYHVPMGREVGFSDIDHTINRTAQ